MAVWKYQKRYWPKNSLDFAPQDMVPNGDLVLLTGIIRYGEFQYYVLPRHILYLDANKGGGAALYDGMEGRYGILVVDEAHEDAFFRAIEPHKRSPERLRDELFMCVDGYERLNYVTEVLIDFDRRHMMSCYHEGAYHEFYRCVPEGWTSEYARMGASLEYYYMDDGLDGKPEKNIGISGLEKDYIPLDKRFWIDENGKSLFWLLDAEGERRKR